MNTVILRMASRFLVPLSLLFAVFIYFKGHQSPGGGFVAGLVAAVALILHRMALGGLSMNRMLPAPERIIMAVGLAMALITGLVPLLFGLPFFTSNHGYLPLPDMPKGIEWATVMVFDLGVVLVVMGVVVGMINTLCTQLEDWGSGMSSQTSHAPDRSQTSPPPLEKSP